MRVSLGVQRQYQAEENLAGNGNSENFQMARMSGIEKKMHLEERKIMIESISLADGIEKIKRVEHLK